MCPIFASMRYLVWIWILSPLWLSAQDKKEPIQINHADYLEYNKGYVNADRLVGHVSMSQGSTTLTCDSAWFWKADNRMEAFGHACLIQPGGVSVWSDYMLYDGNTKTATAQSNVRMTDGKMTLTTDAIRYDVTEKIAYYVSGGKIVDGENTMTSKSGSYHTKNRAYFFKGKIKLVNPEYTMECDTLNYNGNNRTAYFFGPTHIYSPDNLLFCNYGWYNTRNNTCQFSKRAYILSKENRIDSDSFLYDRNTGVGRAFGNIVLKDTAQKITIYGQKGLHHRFEKTTLISGNPMAQKIMDTDTFYIKAMYLYDKLDTATQKRTLSAYRQTQLFKSDIQGIGDSLSYSLSDSVIKMFDQPVLWNEMNQITGDTIVILQKGRKIDRMNVLQNAMMIMEEAPDKFNQIKGKKMHALFSNNALYTVHVRGNGQSIYYAKEDSTRYTGVNYVECTNMVIRVDSNKVKKVTFLVKPKGTFYPVNQFPAEQTRLRGFLWMIEKRPLRADFARK